MERPRETPRESRRVPFDDHVQVDRGAAEEEVPHRASDEVQRDPVLPCDPSRRRHDPPRPRRQSLEIRPLRERPARAAIPTLTFRLSPSPDHSNTYWTE